MKLTRVAYQEIAESVPDGAVLLYRGSRRLYQRAIRAAGRTPYSHAAMLGWWDSEPMVLETTRFGGRAITLESQVRTSPGKWDVYQVNVPSYRPDLAVEYMRKHCGQPYGWLSLFRAALLHLPVVRWFVRPDISDEPNGSMPYCSSLVSAACYSAGVDLVPRLAGRLTEPGDLARSAALTYCYTLGWDT